MMSIVSAPCWHSPCGSEGRCTLQTSRRMRWQETIFSCALHIPRRAPQSARKSSCVLPFDNSQATFIASIGREDRPVLVSCAPYIGGGFRELYAGATKMMGFAASFEFGGGGAFAFGPLSGEGRITVGMELLPRISKGKSLRRRRTTPNAVNGTLPPRWPENAERRPREYRTVEEVTKLMDAARELGRYGHCDTAMILIAYSPFIRAEGAA